MRWLPICLIFLNGCAATMVQLTDAGANVSAGMNDAAPGLKEIGPIEAVNGSGCGLTGTEGTYEGAYTTLKNKAAEMGATYVQIIQTVQPRSEHNCYDNRFTIRGRAFSETGRKANQPLKSYEPQPVKKSDWMDSGPSLPGR